MLNVAHDPAVNSQVYSHRASSRQDQGRAADDFSSMVDSNAAAADRDVPAPPSSSQSRAARQADDHDRASRDTGNDADPVSDTQQAAPRTGVVHHKGKKSSSHEQAASAKTGLSEGKSGSRLKQDAADETAADTSKAQQAGDLINPNAVVVPAPAATVETAAQPDGQSSEEAAGTAASASGVSASVAVAATAAADAAAVDTEAAAGVSKPGVDAVGGHPSSGKSKTDPAKASADGVIPTAGDDANAAALSTGIAVPQQAAAAGAMPASNNAAKAEAVAAIGQSKPAKAAAKAADADEASAKTGIEAKPAGSKPDSSSVSADDAGADHGKGDVAVKTETGATSATPAHDRRGAEPQTAKPDISFQAALDLQAPVAPQTQTQQQFTVTAAGPAASAQAASVPVPVNGLAVDIATRAAAGNTSFQIRLDPAELGRIDVRLDVDKHGRVTSHLTVDQPATLDMLRRDAPQLQRALEDAGLKTGDGGLQFSLRDQSPQGGQGDSGQGRQSHRLIVSEEISATPQVAGASYGRASGASSGVDISI